MRLSLECLDNKRLGKQRVESYQIWRAITGVRTHSNAQQERAVQRSGAKKARNRTQFPCPVLLLLSGSLQASQTKSWRTSPAIHMWRGYPHALGVYLYINCRVWASRKSATTGKFFSNDKMDEHIQTYNFGKNEHGKLVYNMEDEEEDNEAQAPEADEEEKKAELPAAVVDAANTAFAPAAAAVTAAPAAAAAGAGAQVASAVPVAAAAAAAGAAAARPGTYEDGIRIPWSVSSSLLASFACAALDLTHACFVAASLLSQVVSRFARARQ